MPGLTPQQKGERIAALFRERRHVDVLPDELTPASVDEGYAIRAAYEAADIAAGRGAVAGFKIAITTKVMQELCGLDEPCYGAIFAPEVHQGVARLKASDYDYIIFDMPAVSQTNSTLRVAGLMDVVLLVAEAEKTSRAALRRANEQLKDAQANVKVVLNKTHEYIPERLNQDS